MAATGTKVFVGCLPYSKVEADVQAVFEVYGTVAEVAMLRKPDGASKGAAFVTYQDSSAAENAVACLQGHLFEGSTRGLNVSFASAEPKVKAELPAAGGSKLFVGCLPYSKGEAEVQALFEMYGAVQEVALMRKPDGLSKGAALVTFQANQSAADAMACLQGHVFEGSPRGLNITYATQGGGGKGAAPRPPRPPQPQWGMPQQQWGMPQQQWGQQWQQPQQQFRPNGYGQRQVVPGPPSIPGAPGTKVFVGQLPYSKTESDLWQLFSSVAHVQEVVLMKNGNTGQPKGAAFVRFADAYAAQTAVAQLDGFVFAGSPRAIKVTIANDAGGGPAVGQKRTFSSMAAMGQQAPTAYRPPGAPAGAPGQTGDQVKLFVGQLPFSKNEQEIAQVFGKLGQVAEVFLHKDAQGQKKGAAFVKYTVPEIAYQALEFDGYLFDGATRPITVALAQESKKKQKVM